MHRFSSVSQFTLLGAVQSRFLFLLEARAHVGKEQSQRGFKEPLSCLQRGGKVRLEVVGTFPDEPRGPRLVVV